MVNWHRLEDFVQSQMQRGRVPGLALAILYGGDIVYARGFGVTSVETGIPVTAESLFRIGSVTKSFTGTTIMRMVQDGRLELDRPVKDYIDWFRLSDPDATQRVTLRHLLSHTSGLPSEYVPDGPRDPSGLEPVMREETPEYALFAPPGSVYYYSNPGVNLAGCIAQAVAGTLYPQLVQELIFDPLNMKHSTFDITVAATYPLALGHYPTPDGGYAVEHRWNENAARNPAGGIISNVLDLCRFAQLHLQGGTLEGESILRRDLVEEMRRPHARLLNVANSAYGLTMRIDSTKGITRTGHTGWSPPFGCRWILVPERGLAVACTLSAHSDETADAIVDYCLDEILGLPAGHPAPVAAEPDRALWAGFEGTYVGDVPGLVRVLVQDGRLVADWNGRPLQLTCLRPNVYFAVRPGGGKLVSVGFVEAQSGPVEYIQVDGEPCRRLDPEVQTVETAPHCALVGDYRLAGLGLLVREDGERLTMQPLVGGPAVPLTQLGGTRYVGAYGTSEFRMGADGRAESVLVSARARLVRTERQ